MVPARSLDREGDILREALAQVRQRLPGGWDLQIEETGTTLFGLDAVASIASPRGGSTRLVIDVRPSLVTREARMAADELQRYITTGLAAGRTPTMVRMVVARYLPPTVRSWLTDNDVAYADATGNLRIALERPALFLRDVGAARDPWRGPGRPKGDLRGGPAARVVRALTDYTPPYSIPQLVKLSGASNGATYRVIAFLEDEDLIEREPRGPITEVKWRRLLERWSQDYGFQRSNAVETFLAPRGLPALMAGLEESTLRPEGRYAVTGSLAAQQWAPYAPARSVMLYAENTDALAVAVGLRKVDGGANVLLARNRYDVVYERTVNVDGATIVAPSQAVVDLMTGPGRNPVEADALLDWMEGNVDKWRTQ